MQSYSENAQKRNIFVQMREWNADRSKRLTNSEVNKIVKLRSDKTHVDEALLVMRVALVFVTIFTSYCGFLFYESTFSKVFSPTEAWMAAVGLAIVTEAAKIFLLHRFLRAIFFGWISADWWSLGGWLFIGALAIGAYIWSVRISTDGMEMLTKQVAESSTPKDNLAALIKENTADIDAQIAASQASQSAAINTKWKGTTTWRAQKSAASSGAAIASLQEQRATIVYQVTKDYQTRNQHRAENITQWAYWIERYGGYMELVAALCIFSVVFFERRLVAHNMNMATNDDSAPTPTQPNAVPHYSQPAQNGTGQFYNTSKVGFNLDESGNVRSAAHRPPQPVNGLPTNQPETLYHNVPQTNLAIGADEVIKHYKTLLGRDVANLRNENGRPHTVADRLHANIIRYSNIQREKGFYPDKRVGTEMYLFLETVFQTLGEYSRAYPYAKEVLKDLHKHIDEQEYQTRKAEQARA